MWGNVILIHLVMWLIGTIVAYRSDTLGVQSGRIAQHTGLWANVCWGFIWIFSIPDEILKTRASKLLLKGKQTSARELSEPFQNANLEQWNNPDSFDPNKHTSRVDRIINS